MEMNAILVTAGNTNADALVLGQTERPDAGPGQILIRVHAAGVNRPDIAQREGNYPPPPGASPIIGLEVSGEVVALGDGAERWQVGDRVTALLPGGGYADYAVVDARHALPIPQGLTLAEAAGLPETVFTVWANLFESGRLTKGETVLIHGANSGIGITAIRMAKAAGARVIATARGADKVARAADEGADRAIDIESGDFVEAARTLGGADVVLDILGGEHFARNLDALKPDGRLVQIAFLAGRKVELDLMTLLFKRLTITGSTLRARSPDEKARLARAIEERVWPWIESGIMRASIDREIDMGDAASAHRALENGTQFGKVVLRVAREDE